MTPLHVLPWEDLIQHEQNDDCICGPSQEMVEQDDGSDGWIVLHHALDGRPLPDLEEQIEEEPWDPRTCNECFEQGLILVPSTNPDWGLLDLCDECRATGGTGRLN